MNKTINETIQDMMTNGARERLVSLDAECRESSASRPAHSQGADLPDSLHRGLPRRSAYADTAASRRRRRAGQGCLRNGEALRRKALQFLYGVRAVKAAGLAKGGV